jgi:eukaryotic-like serine/threonine-protein kinase
MSALDTGDFDGNDRFEVQGRLGAGGYGVVYRVMDRERNIPVALKTLRNVAPRALVRFKQEFRALADVSHPNLVTLYELSSHDHQWFFTMELVDGVNFLWYVRGAAYPAESSPTSAVSPPTGSDLRAFFDHPEEEPRPLVPAPEGTLDLDRLRHALPQLAEGVLTLHEAGKLHRDIKPSNVLVTRGGRVVVLDFGLVADIAPAHTHTVDMVGTPAYMSPEQVAGLPLTRASDWYNVGALLYQALTGQLPFTGPPLEVMRRKQEREPPPPREVAPDVPADLDALCQDLLRRDPARRPSGAEVMSVLKGTPGAGPVAVAVAPASVFVGRDPHLAVLREAFARLKSGRGLTVAVHGASGMGKTALVRRFLDELKAEEAEAVVLVGRCYERESVPYKALDALVDALSRFLRRLPAAQAEAFLPHDILALARVFPVLRQVEAVNRARRAVLEIPDSLELRRRAFAALRELLVRLADRRPLVLFIDDLQWGDADSAALLEELLRPPDPPALLLIGCYRSEEALTSPLLKAILPKRLAPESTLEVRDIVVGELSAAESSELALALVAGEAQGRQARAEAIARESRGNPYFIEELARYGSAPAANVTFDRVLETRVARLAPGARRLLDMVAVAGAPVEAGVACRAAELEQESESVLAALRAGHLVRTRSAPGRQEIETYHDRIRDAVVARLEPETLRECHRRLVSALLASGRAAPEALAMHSLAAGDPDSAAEFAGAAAAKASEALAFDRAADLYRFALQLGHGTPAEQAKVQVQLGDALANAGRGAEAAQAYLSAAMASGPVLSVELHRRAAQQFYVSGHIEDGLRVLTHVLAKLDMTLPATARQALLSLFFRRAQIRLRGLRFAERHESEIAGQDLLRIDTCWAVGVSMGPLDMVRGADFQARHLLLALRAGEPYRIARALAMEANYVAMRGNKGRARARRLLQASQTLAQRVRHPYAIGLATLTAGNAAWLDGRWRDARGLCESAEQILREQCTGVRVWEILIAQLFGLASMFFLGEVDALSRRLPRLLEEAEGRGSLLRAAYLRVGFCSHVAWLAADDPTRARQEIEQGLSAWRQGSFDYLQLWVRGAQTDIALYSGEPPLASPPVGKPWRAFAHALDRFVQTGYIRGLDSRARRRLAAAAHATGPGERRTLVQGAEGHARAILREKTRWGDPLALLLRAGAAATRGEPERAVPLLESAEDGFVAAEMALHTAAARRRRGELVGGDAGRSLLASADSWMSSQGIKNPARMTAMLAPGRWRAD